MSTNAFCLKSSVTSEFTTYLLSSLQEEFRVVAEKDKELKIREKKLLEREAQLSRLIDEEVVRRIALNQTVNMIFLSAIWKNLQILYPLKR